MDMILNALDWPIAGEDKIRPFLPHDLHSIAYKSSVTKQRKKHPFIAPFMSEHKSIIAVQRLIEKTRDVEHPTDGILFVGQESRILGAGLVHRCVTVYEKPETTQTTSIARRMPSNYNIIAAWLITENPDDIAKLYRKIVNEYDFGNELPVGLMEPLASPAELHEAFRQEFDNPNRGHFMLEPNTKNSPANNFYTNE